MAKAKRANLTKRAVPIHVCEERWRKPNRNKTNFSPLPIIKLTRTRFIRKDKITKHYDAPPSPHNPTLPWYSAITSIYSTHTQAPNPQSPLLLRNLGVTGTVGGAVGGGEVYPEGTAKEDPSHKLLPCSNSRLDISEVGMSEASWLTSSPIEIRISTFHD